MLRLDVDLEREFSAIPEGVVLIKFYGANPQTPVSSPTSIQWFIFSVNIRIRRENL